MDERPDGQLGPIVDLELSKDPVQVFLYRAFGQMKLMSNLLIGFAKSNQGDDLPFPNRELTLEDAFLIRLGLPAGGTNSLLRVRSKFCTAAETTLGHCEDSNLADHIRNFSKLYESAQMCNPGTKL
jgi:hypothetical protein